MKNDVLIQVNDLSCFYGRVCAVDRLNFSVERGEVLGFLGPNGAGKSTTMRMLAGILAPSSGQILVDGVDIQKQPNNAKKNIGYLPETPPLYLDATVDEYLRYCLLLHQIPWSMHARILLKRVKQRCGLEQVGQRLIANLSKGYQQRVGIAQAILHNPAVVILDEPTVGLDPNQIREIRDLIKELGEDHGVIVSTHILPEVHAICDRVLIINQGRLVLNETLANLNQQAGAAKLIVGLRHPPVSNVFEVFPGVESVSAIDTQRFLILHRRELSPTDEIIKWSVQQGWGLFELAPLMQNLEETFIQLTCHEEQMVMDREKT